MEQPMTSKLISIDDVSAILKQERSRGKKIVQSHGMFDRLHVGHFRHLRQAKQLGDILVVSIFPDRHAGVENIGGSIRESERAEALSLLEWVDFVVIDREESIEQTLAKINPDIFVSGREEFRDFRPFETTKELSRILKSLGIKKVHTKDSPFSAESPAYTVVSNFSDEIKKYIKLFKTRHNSDELYELLDQMRSLNVLVIGDTILDEYCYCHTLGVSSKDPTLAVQYASHEIFAGGILAIANHVANFCKKVHLITLIGDNPDDEPFIRSKLHPGVTPYFLILDRAPTLVKKRIVEVYSLNKLLEIYTMDDSGPGEKQEAELCEYIRKRLPQHDMVIAGDFGHGAITKKIRTTLISDAPFLSVNTQANAGNKRIHTISRYSRADFVSIAEHELRLETRDLQGDVRPMIQRLKEQLSSRAFIVTRGKKGSCIAHSPGGSYCSVPSFARTVVDRVGAGDASFAVSAMAAYLNAPAELIAFLGNIAGAIAVEIVGNKRSVTPSDVKEYIAQLMR